MNTQELKMKSKRLKWFLLIVLALIWGSSYILIKRGLLGLNPFQLGSLRIIFAAIFLLIIGFKSITTILLYQWKFIALTAFLGTFIPAYFFSIAETQIDSSVTSIINSLTPLSTLVLGVLVFNLEFKRSHVFGVLIGLSGTALLIFNGALNHPNQNYVYSLWVIIATICYALNVNIIKKQLSDLSPLAITTGNFTVLLIPALIILFFSGFFDVVYVPKVQYSMMFVLVLGVIGTGIANIVFFKLIQISSPVFATSVTYLIPIVAFCWGLLDNEMLSPVQFVGAFIILIGVYLSSKK